MKTLTLFAGLLLSFTFAVAQTTEPSAPATQSTSAAKNGASVQKPAVSPELVAARKQLAVLRARHGENPPAVETQLRKVVELQKKAVKRPAAAAADDKATQLEAAKQELQTLRQRFTDEHPIVKNQLKKIAALEAANAQ